MQSTIWWYPLIFVVGFFAGLIDAIAGGGGLITLPVLLGFGIPPQAALGTNKLQSCFGSFTAASYHVQQGVVNLKQAAPGIIFTFIGAAAGTVLVQRVDNSLLQSIIPFMLIGIAIYFLFSPRIGDLESHPRMVPFIFYFTFGFALGFYDGFFGPGVGSFWVVAFVGMLGYTLTTATGYTKVMNFVSNICAFLIFLIKGNILFTIGLVMASGQVVGARLGSGFVLENGARFIRPIYLIIVLLTMIKLFYQHYSLP
ncbi:MAG: TSUP family transporter [Bacteroidota bacterium]